tara:strand:- start:9161 stop:9607 length:447 start_codon:yes stop_codon:yes gene_type:complete
MNKAGKKFTAKFPKPKNVGKRDWGEETLLSIVENNFMMKKLVIKKGHKGGLQYHRKKNEVAIIIKGRLKIRYDDLSGNLVEKVLTDGDVVHFPPGTIHQEEAIEESTLIECSTIHFNDRVRCERLYGLKEEEGLPTTNLEDIKNSLDK